MKMRYETWIGVGANVSRCEEEMHNGALCFTGSEDTHTPMHGVSSFIDCTGRWGGVVWRETFVRLLSARQPMNRGSSGKPAQIQEKVHDHSMRE